MEKSTSRDIYEKKIEQEENDYRDRVKRYYRQRTAIKNKTEKLFNELIPMIDKFSPNHYKYNSGYGGYEIEDIRKFENL